MEVRLRYMGAKEGRGGKSCMREARSKGHLDSLVGGEEFLEEKWA